MFKLPNQRRHTWNVSMFNLFWDLESESFATLSILPHKEKGDWIDHNLFRNCCCRIHVIRSCLTTFSTWSPISCCTPSCGQNTTTASNRRRTIGCQDLCLFKFIQEVIHEQQWQEWEGLQEARSWEQHRRTPATSRRLKARCDLASQVPRPTCF